MLWVVVQDPATLPSSVDDQIDCAAFSGGVYAVQGFGGTATEHQLSDQTQTFQKLIARDSLIAAGDECILAQYYGLSTKGHINRNELLQKLEKFDVWG